MDNTKNFKDNYKYNTKKTLEIIEKNRIKPPDEKEETNNLEKKEERE